MTIKDQMQAQFAANAQSYVTSKTHRQTADLDLLLRHAAFQPGDTVLDVATGGGHTALAVAPHVAAVVATDLTPAMLSAAAAYFVERGATNIRTELADAEALPFADASFDAVTCRTAAHHFPAPAQFAREAARVLRPGGRLLLIDNSVPAAPAVDQFVNDIQKLHDQSHVRAYSQAEWAQFAADAGLVVDHSELLSKHLEMTDWCDRASVPPARRAAIQALFAAASPDIIAAMQPEHDAAGVAGFALPVLLLVAHRPA